MNDLSCHFLLSACLSSGRRAKKEGCENALTPFQKALIKAVLRRYERELSKEQLSMSSMLPEQCLWIDWKSGTVSATQKEGYSVYFCTSDNP